MSSSLDRLLSFYEAAAFGPLAMPLAIGSTIASTVIGAAGQMQAGDNAAALGRYQNQEYQQQAETATATGQRAMLEERRKAGLVESSLQARGAASGGSATAGSTVKLASDIAGRGEYNALMDLSQGQNQAAGLDNEGAAAVYRGSLAKQGDDMSALGTIAGGAGSFARTLSSSSGGFGGFGGGSYGIGPSMNLGY